MLRNGLNYEVKLLKLNVSLTRRLAEMENSKIELIFFSLFV